MENRKTRNIGGTILLVAAGVTLTVAGFIVIPPLIQKYGNKTYKASLKREVIDFDNMGPKIVPLETTEDE